MGSPKLPPTPTPPAAPPLPPQLPNTAVQAAGAQDVLRIQSARGLGGTILTGGQGLPGGGQQFGSKTLLGL